jgi:dTMP kinase
MRRGTVGDDTARYVALEGIEGAGKTTLAQLLGDALRAAGHAVTHVREPGGTAVGEQIRQVVLGNSAGLEHWAEALLFAAARSQLAAEVIAPALARDEWVVSDRSVYSSLAYQGGGRRLGVTEVRAVNEAGLGSVWPDRVVLLRVDPDVGLGRQAVADRIGAEGAEFQRRVGDTFGRLAAAEPDRFIVIEDGAGADAALASILTALGIRA